MSLSFYYLSGRILENSISSSYSRYFLPVYILSVPFVSFLILNLKQKYIGILISFLFIIVHTFAVLSLININVDQLRGMSQMKNEIEQITEPNAVIFLDYWDKAIFPARRVGLVKELPEENRSEILAEIAIRVSEKMVPTYFLIERNFESYITQKDLENELELRGYKLQGIGMVGLYELANLKGE